MKIIQSMDLFLGVPSILLDTDEDRRKMYGKAGEFRHKSYGVEYRVLSNFWLQSEEHVEWVFKNIYRALEFAENNTIDSETRSIILDTINNTNKDSAQYLCEIFEINNTIKLKDVCVE